MQNCKWRQFPLSGRLGFYRPIAGVKHGEHTLPTQEVCAACLVCIGPQEGAVAATRMMTYANTLLLSCVSVPVGMVCVSYSNDHAHVVFVSHRS